MFKLANRYDSRQRGLRSKITQLFVYCWFGEARGARFDAGLVNPDGTPRKAYSVFAKTAKTHRVGSGGHGWPRRSARAGRRRYSFAGGTSGVVNLYSDTQTRPTPAMRRAMAEAEVGDEQSFADPTVNALCERVADLLGHEAAVFLPSGTMCNAIAFRLHVRPGGDEVVLHRTSHPIIAEAGGPAAISGAVLCPVDGDARHVRRRHAARAAAAARRPLHPALAAGLARADDEHHRRPRVAAGADAVGARRGARGRACARTSTARG